MALKMLFEMVVGGTTYYMSNETVALNNYYNSFVVTLPEPFELTAKGIGEAFVEADLSNFTLTNDPHNPDHPFSFPNATYPVSHIPYNIKIYYGNGIELFDGACEFRGWTNDKTELVFDLIRKINYEINVLDMTLPLEHFTISNITNPSGTETLITTSETNDLQTGDTVIMLFESNTGDLGYSQLSYDRSNDIEEFTITVVSSGSTFTLDNVDYSTLTGSGVTGTSKVGRPVVSPKAFGPVNHRIPVIIEDSVLVNPGLLHTGLIKVYDDGVLIGAYDNGAPTAMTVTSATNTTNAVYTLSALDTNYEVNDLITVTGITAAAGDGSLNGSGFIRKINTDTNQITTSIDASGDGAYSSGGSMKFGSELSTAPTTTRITLNGPPTGETSVSGTTVSYNDLDGFMDWVVGELGITIDITKASNAGNIPVQFYVDSQIKILDLASKICYYCNHSFYILNDILYLIDRGTLNGSSTTIGLSDIVSIEIENTPLIKLLKSTWVNRVSFTGVSQRLGECFKEAAVNNSSSKSGVEITIEPYTENIFNNRTRLREIITIEKRPIVTLIYKKVTADITIGDRLIFNDEIAHLCIDMIVRELEYISDEHTVLRGDATITAITVS